MGAAVAVVDGVGEAEHLLLVAIGPLQRDLDRLFGRAALARLRAGRSAPGGAAVRFWFMCSTKLRMPPSYWKSGLLAGALVDEQDEDAAVEERQLAQALRQRVGLELEHREDRRVGVEPDAGAGDVGRLAERAIGASGTPQR